MKHLLLTVALLIPFVSNAQKFKEDDGLITVDGQPYCLVEKIRGGGEYDFRVLALDSTELIYLNGRSYNDPSQVSQPNPKGRIFYDEWTFLASGAKMETDGVTTKMLAKRLYQGHLLKNGTLDPAAERTFVSVNGKPHSQRQEQLGLPVIIIQR